MFFLQIKDLSEYLKDPVLCNLNVSAADIGPLAEYLNDLVLRNLNVSAADKGPGRVSEGPGPM